MGASQIVIGAVYLALAAGALRISCLQFREKGFLFNNGWLWASPEERRRMRAEDKRPLYRQSGVVFLLLGLTFLTLAVQIVTYWLWLFFPAAFLILSAIIYGVASSVKIERRK